MGLPLEKREAGETIPCARAITSSMSPCEADFGGLHIARGGSQHKDSALEAFKEDPLRRVCSIKGLSGLQSIEGSISILSGFQALALCSPSESFTWSKVSELGSPSSPSSSSLSFFSEAGTSVVEELSPASFKSAELLQEANCWPARRSFQRASLAPNLITVAPSSKWDDTEMHCKCTSSPAQSHAVKATTVDNLPLGDNLLVEGTKIRRQLCSKSRTDHLGHRNVENVGCSKGDKIPCDHVDQRSSTLRVHLALNLQADVTSNGFSSSSCPESLHSVLERPGKFSGEEIDGKVQRDGYPMPAIFPHSDVPALSYRKCTVISNPPLHGANAAVHSTVRSHSDRREGSCKHKRDCVTAMQCELHADEHAEQRNVGSKLRKECTSDMLPERLMHVKAPDAQLSPNCAVECSSTPYEADIGVDMLSLQPRLTSLSPSKRNPSMASPLHQRVHINASMFSFQTAMTRKPKLEAQCSIPLRLFEKGTTFQESTERRTATGTVFGKKKELPSGSARGKASAEKALSGFSERKPSNIEDLNKPRSIVHPPGETQEDAKPILVSPMSKKHNYQEIPKPSIAYGKFTDKADAFTLHSPLLLKELKYSERSSTSTVDPAIPLSTSKVGWDWRSKSMGAKASLKSAVKNLEATFSSSRSVSLPKARPWSQKDTKTESARLLERVFVSPIKARSKQAGFLKPIERPLFPGRHSNEPREYGVLRRRDTNVQSHHTTTCAPTGFGSRPFPPNRYREVEVTCKPFLPASKCVRSLPTPRASSGRRGDGLSSAPDGASPSMSHAQLQCLLKDGLPFYSMTVEGSEEMLLARASWQVNPWSKEGCSWQYTFQAGHGNGKARDMGGASRWRSWINKESKTVSDLSGIMLVSSTSRHDVALTPKEVQPLKELEFVLYDGKGVGVTHSQSLRFYSSEKLCQKSGLVRDNLSSFSSPLDASTSRPSQLDRETTKKQHARRLTDLTMSSESTNTSSSKRMGTAGGHRSSLSLDVGIDSDVPDTTQAPTSDVELAAFVIQVSPEGSRKDSNVCECDLIGKTSTGWGLKFLEDGIGSKPSGGCSQSGVERAMTFGYNAFGQAGLGEESKPCPPCTRVNSKGLPRAVETFQHLSTQEEPLRQGSPGSVTLLLPSGNHGFPNGGNKGPSSLIDRWRSGGSCECGGWDLGCGIKVVRSGSFTRSCSASNRLAHTSVSFDQQLCIFGQGSKQELMLGLLPIQQGEFKLSFQGQLSPLKAFAAAVAMLHSLEPMLLPPSSPPAPPSTTSTLTVMPSTLLPFSSPLPMSSSSRNFPLQPSLLMLPSISPLKPSSAAEAGSMVYNPRERPPRPPHIHLKAPRRSADSSCKDKITPFLVHNQTFSN